MSEPREFTEEQLSQIEEEMERISVDDVLLQTLVTLLNLAARKAGLGRPPGTASPPAPPPDLEQMGQAIEGARALMPLVEKRHSDQLGQVRDMLSQLQMAFSQLAQGAEKPQPGPADKESEPGPPKSSGRLWIPGQ